MAEEKVVRSEKIEGLAIIIDLLRYRLWLFGAVSVQRRLI